MEYHGYVTISEEDAAAIADVDPDHEGPVRKKRMTGKKGGKKGGLTVVWRCVGAKCTLSKVV